MNMRNITEVCSVKMGQSPDSKTYNYSRQGIPFYQGNADFGEIHPRTRIWCTAPVKIANKGDILLSVRAPIGAMNISTEKCCIGRGLAAITPNKEKCDEKFLYYAIMSKIPLLVSQGTGSTFKAIGRKVLEKTMIPDYTIERQSQIAKLMSFLEQLINVRNKQLINLEKLVKSRFIEMFGDTTLNPYGWDKDYLGTVCDVRDGTHDSPKYYKTGYPLVTSKNVTAGRIDLSNCSLISETDYNKINERSKVDTGDIIMPMIGTVGKPVIVDIEPNFAIKNVALIKFKQVSKVLNIYIQALLQSDYFNDSVLNKVRGGTQKFISLGDMRNIDILVPPIELQNQFAAFVKQVDKSKFEIKQSLEKLELLKKALMQKYFG